MLTAEVVKKEAKALGADLVGIASMDRYEGAPLQMDPRQIMPEARSLIVMAFRVMRGSLRGVEEGTFFSNYSAMGYGGLTYLYMPLVVINLCRFIEDHGKEAIPIGHQSDWRAIDGNGFLREGYSRPVELGRAAPDVMIHLRIAGYLAGLGEIGYSKMFISPQFGPRQRLAAVLTDAPLDPDPLYSGPPLCDRCMACARECSGGAISMEKTVKVTVAGRELEWGEIDYQKCSRYFCGASKAHNPFMTSKEDEEGFNQPVGAAQRYKVGPTYDYGRALEGASGCIRACMVHLEERGKLQNTFHNRFRKRKPWKLE